MCSPLREFSQNMKQMNCSRAWGRRWVSASDINKQLAISAPPNRIVCPNSFCFASILEESKKGAIVRVRPAYRFNAHSFTSVELINLLQIDSLGAPQTFLTKEQLSGSIKCDDLARLNIAPCVFAISVDGIGKIKVKKNIVFECMLMFTHSCRTSH